MSSTWSTRSLGEIAKISKGVSYKSSELSAEGRVLVNLKNVAKGGGFRPEGNKHFTGEVRAERLLRGGELLIAYTDLTKEREILGCPVIVPELPEYVDATFSMDLGRIDPDPDILDVRFLFHWLQSSTARAYMKANGSGATVMHLRTASVPEMQISLPPLDEQKRIVAKLDEIGAEVKQAIIGMEQSTKDLDQLQQRAVESVIKVPCKEASKVLLADVAKIESTLVDPTKATARTLPHLGAGNILAGSTGLTEVKTAQEEGLVSAKFLFTESDVLYSKIRPYLRKVWMPDFPGLCSADMYPLRVDSKCLDREFLFWTLLSDDFTSYAENGSARAGMPKVNRKHLFAYELNLPCMDCQKVQVRKVRELVDATKSLRRKSDAKHVLINQFQKRALTLFLEGAQ